VRVPQSVGDRVLGAVGRLTSLAYMSARSTGEKSGAPRAGLEEWAAQPRFGPAEVCYSFLFFFISIFTSTNFLVFLLQFQS
jgi:hypothetical protein